jgi:glycosyltransferase involved in cell wall biosynthesis
MLATLDGVAAAGFEILVACPAHGPLAETLADRGIATATFQAQDSSGARRPQSELREELASLVARLQPDLVHANSLSMGRLSGPVIAAVGVPSLAHLRDIVRLSPQAVRDVNCHRRLLAVSHATREYHLQGGLAAEKTFVLYNGVDLQRFRPQTPTGCLHRELGLQPHARLVAAIGQIGLRKGFDVLLQAAQYVRLSSLARSNSQVGKPDVLGGDIHYVLIGQRWSDKDESRRFEQNLHEQAAGPLSGHVHFLGRREDVDRLLCEFALLVHPARQEPLGRVLLEAAAVGTAIIATDVGGTCEIFPPETNSARLVPPDDPRQLAAAISELLTEDDQRSRMGVRARHRAEDAFSVERATEGLIRHYHEVGR